MALGVGGDKVPLPWRRTSKCSAASSSMALRTVPWLTRKRAAVPFRWNGSPGFHSPAAGFEDQALDLLVQAGLNAGAGQKPPQGWLRSGVRVVAGGRGKTGTSRSDANHILYKT